MWERDLSRIWFSGERLSGAHAHKEDYWAEHHTAPLRSHALVQRRMRSPEQVHTRVDRRRWWRWDQRCTQTHWRAAGGLYTPTAAMTARAQRLYSNVWQRIQLQATVPLSNLCHRRLRQFPDDQLFSTNHPRPAGRLHLHGDLIIHCNRHTPVYPETIDY